MYVQLVRCDRVSDIQHRMHIYPHESPLAIHMHTHTLLEKDISVLTYNYMLDNRHLYTLMYISALHVSQTNEINFNRFRIMRLQILQ